MRNENEIPLFREFPFLSTIDATLRVFILNTFVAVGYNIRKSINCALFWHN